RLSPGVPLPPGTQFSPSEHGDPSSSSSTADFPGVAQMPLRPGTASGANSLAQSDWSIVTSPNISTTQNNLLGVTCVSASDCWTVGSYVAGSGAPRTLIEHWDGTAWAIVASPNASLPNNVLSGVTCVSASDCWAVGYYVTGPSVYQTLIERWDGTAWTIVASPNAAPLNILNGVTSRSASDCWSVGYSGAAVGTGAA